MSSAPELLNDLQQAHAWLRARVTGQLRTDSRLVQPGDGFIAWPGGVTDGREHVRVSTTYDEKRNVLVFDDEGQVRTMTRKVEQLSPQTIRYLHLE